jgi:hypothetical protein
MYVVCHLHLLQWSMQRPRLLCSCCCDCRYVVRVLIDELVPNLAANARSDPVLCQSSDITYVRTRNISSIHHLLYDVLF